MQDLIPGSQGSRGDGFLLVPPATSQEVHAAAGPAVRLPQELQDGFFQGWVRVLQIGMVLKINKRLLRLFFATGNYLGAGDFKSF